LKYKFRGNFVKQTVGSNRGRTPNNWLYFSLTTFQDADIRIVGVVASHTMGLQMNLSITVCRKFEAVKIFE